MTRAVCYARVSTAEQAESRLGLESQVKMCRDYIERQGWGFMRQYLDEGVSASTPLLERPWGRQLCDLPDDVVIVALCQDRLFRSVADMLATWERLPSPIVTVDEGQLDLDDPEKWFTTIIKAVFGEYERRKTGSRISRALTALKARGGRVGEPPYGWRKTEVRAKFEEHPEEQAVIRTVLELADEMSLRDVAVELNRRGILTRDGKSWSHTQVSRIVGRAGEE